MIFYFSGTGNSLQAAQLLRRENEALVDIGASVKEKMFQYSLESGETLGIVCPVYFYGVPSILSYFLKHLELSGYEPIYTYAVFTCGGSMGGADQMLAGQLLRHQELILDAAFSVKMPDNYIIMYDVQKKEEQTRILAAAETKLAELRKRVMLQECTELSGIKARIVTRLVYPFYKKGRKTEKFWVDDQCVGCGMCAKRCASNAIQLIDGNPVWVKDQCIHCLGCTNRCAAIQYGNKSKLRGRYVNPLWAKH